MADSWHCWQFQVADAAFGSKEMVVVVRFNAAASKVRKNFVGLIFVNV